MMKTMKAAIEGYRAIKDSQQAGDQGEKKYTLINDGGTCKTSKLWSALICAILDKGFNVCAGV